MYIDSHAHIEDAKFDLDRDECIRRAVDAGVEMIVDIGNGDVSRDTHTAAFRVAEQYDFIYTTVGVHPHEAVLLDDSLAATLADWSRNPKVIAWGEIGLDYYYDHSPREIQREAFRRQLRMAADLGLPAVIHTRDAEADTLEILRTEWVKAQLPGIIHCFTGTAEFARQAIEMGFYISFSGVVTFKSADTLRETAKQIPLDRMLVETDSPFLAPVPFRGNRNEPLFLLQTCNRLAELRGLEPEELGRITADNFKRLFNISTRSVGKSD